MSVVLGSLQCESMEAVVSVVLGSLQCESMEACRSSTPCALIAIIILGKETHKCFEQVLLYKLGSALITGNFRLYLWSLDHCKIFGGLLMEPITKVHILQ